MLWSGENSVGERSLILDRRKPEGLAIIHQRWRPDIVIVANMIDDQIGRPRTDTVVAGSLDSPWDRTADDATRGERHGPRPSMTRAAALQFEGTTGVMMRFGGPDSRTFKASPPRSTICDYLANYSGVLALYAPERRGSAQRGRAACWRKRLRGVACAQVSQVAPAGASTSLVI